MFTFYGTVEQCVRMNPHEGLAQVQKRMPVSLIIHRANVYEVSFNRLGR
jgi:hypothetical protein